MIFVRKNFIRLALFFIIILITFCLYVMVWCIYSHIRWSVYYKLENNKVGMFFGEKDGDFAQNLREYYIAHPDNAYDDMPKFLKYDRFIPLAISVPEGFQDWELLHKGLLELQSTPVLLSLSFSNIDDKNLKTLLSTDSIWCLMLYHCKNISVDSLHIIKNCNNLKTLFLDSADLSDNDIKCLYDSSVEHLVLNHKVIFCERHYEYK